MHWWKDNKQIGKIHVEQLVEYSHYYLESKVKCNFIKIGGETHEK